jgi:hypothetical protein
VRGIDLRETFAAQFRNVQPVEHLDGRPSPSSNTWHALAWEYAQRVVEIGYHGSERLLVADCFRRPRCISMRLPESAAWGGAGHGGHASSPPLRPLEPAITFDLQVVNQTESKEILKCVTVSFDDEGAVEMTLDDRTETSRASNAPRPRHP